MSVAFCAASSVEPPAEPPALLRRARKHMSRVSAHTGAQGMGTSCSLSTASTTLYAPLRDQGAAERGQKETLALRLGENHEMPYAADTDSVAGSGGAHGAGGGGQGGAPGSVEAVEEP